MGWKIDGSFKDKPPKLVVIVMPHTSNYDFVIGVMARSILRITDARYLGKSQLFKPPYGWFFRWLGGYPVDRTRDNNLVDAVVRAFNKHDKFMLALAPEGTRSKVDRLKTGFYHIAKKAGIPIVPVAFDYASKKIVIDAPFYPTNNMKEDFRFLIDFYSKHQGKNPENGIDGTLFDKMMNQLE